MIIFGSTTEPRVPASLWLSVGFILSKYFYSKRKKKDISYINIFNSILCIKKVLVEIQYLAIADANVVLKFFDTIFVE